MSQHQLSRLAWPRKRGIPSPSDKTASRVSARHYVRMDVVVSEAPAACAIGGYRTRSNYQDNDPCVGRSVSAPIASA